MQSEKFCCDDLVWVKKRRNYPYWPARIVKCPTVSQKKGQYYVYFFGSRNHAWIMEDLILHHSEQMVRSGKNNGSKTYTRAVNDIVNASVRRKATSPKTKVLNSDKDFTKATTSKQKKMKKNSLTIKKLPLTKSKGPRLDTMKDGRIKQHKNAAPTSKRIGFLGLEMMGQGIVNNLLKSGHHVTVWDRTPENCDEFVRGGAIRGRTPAAVVQASDIIFCYVLDLDAVKSVVFDSDGVLDGLEKNYGGRKGYVEMSCIDDELSHQIEEAILKKGGKYLEAPITGSKQISEAGALLILASGDRELFYDCQTCFRAIAKYTFFLSCDVGYGSKYSLVLSTFMGVLYAELAEAMSLAKRINISQAALLDILQVSGSAPPLVIEKARCILNGEFTVNTPLNHQQRDMNLALMLSQRSVLPMPVTAAGNELFKKAQLYGYGNLDVCAIYNASDS